MILGLFGVALFTKLLEELFEATNMQGKSRNTQHIVSGVGIYWKVSGARCHEYRKIAASSPVAPPRFGIAGRARKDGKGRESFFSFPSTLARASHSCPAFSRRASRTGEEETVEEAGKIVLIMLLLLPEVPNNNIKTVFVLCLQRD